MNSVASVALQTLQQLAPRDDVRHTNINNVTQSNMPLFLNGQTVVPLPRVHDLMLRSAALSLGCVNLVVWCLCFKNKRTAVSWGIACFVVTQFIGVLLNVLPKTGLCEPSAIVTVVFGVGCLLTSAETFNWVLYLRFSIVSPFNRRLRVGTLAWLTLESAAVIANYAFWISEAKTANGDTTRAADVYYGLSIVQACTALYLSAYFVWTYYLPRLRLTRRSSSAVKVFVRTGIMYLCLETTLHCSYTVTSRVVPTIRTGLTALLTSVRHGIFLLFVLTLRKEISRKPSANASPYRAKKTGSSFASNKKSSDSHSEILSDSGPKPYSASTMSVSQSFFLASKFGLHPVPVNGGGGLLAPGRMEHAHPAGTFDEWTIQSEADDDDDSDVETGDPATDLESRRLPRRPLTALTPSPLRRHMG
ncbi:uncharacterized protein EV422DRAFT_83090 [Fimicolochytrium jonesii]|uniref:uncharacterized protein n=1 Tax=Fimicolochytrium jonesii TaxID=1396493 RepID=UPI0022FED3C3|nr:uncharacterized protein EV422DRAFT_83090 [Fimicolochytrium jonesii]KAI8820211.1 hypothetical protein EV422DRAFT_83090 [Fimicolochytrium jonesii]